MKHPKVCLIEWIDSSGTAGWHPLSDVEKLAPDHCTSVGFVISETDAHVTLVQSFTNREAGALNSYDNSLAIPKFAIVRTVIVRRG